MESKIKLSLHSDLVCPRGIHSLKSLINFPFLQPCENSDFVRIIKDISAPCFSGLNSSMIQQSCCMVSERLKLGIQLYCHKKFNEIEDFLYFDKINFVLTNDKQIMLNNILFGYKSFPYINDENIKNSVPWDFNFLNRFQREFTSTRLLIVNNHTITYDPISGVPLPTNYYDPHTKENIGTLKNEFISLIVIDALSSSPEEQDFESKLIKTLITEGKWAKPGMNHNLIIPIFLNANLTDPVLIAFSGLIHDSEIYIGQVVQQAMSITIWNSFWLQNEKVLFEIKVVQNPNIILKYGEYYIYFLLLKDQLMILISQLCQIFCQFPITENEIWLIHIILMYVSLIANIFRQSKVKLSYLSDFVTKSFNQKNELDFCHPIDAFIWKMAGCLNKLPFFKPSNNSSSWMINQLVDVLVDFNFSVFGLYIDKCDFDLNLKFNTTYQKNEDSGQFLKTSLNLIECFCSNATFGKRIPFPLLVNVLMMWPYYDKDKDYSSCPNKKFLPFIMAFLKVTMSQIMYCPENSIIPVWSSAVTLVGNKLNFIGLFAVLTNFRIILEAVSELEENLYNINIACIRIYIIELIYQTVCPLIECKMINLFSNDIRNDDTETNNVWVELKQMFESFPRPKQGALTLKDYKTLSMSEIITKRWTDIDIQIEWYQNFLNRLTDLILTTTNNERINLASLGLQRWNKYLSNEPHLFEIRPLEGAIYIDEIRSALHFQFAMLFLTPEGLSRNFKELQENSWRCHPLYSPDPYTVRPPHCAIPERHDDNKSEFARSTNRVSAAGQNCGSTSNQPILISSLGLEERRLPDFRDNEQRPIEKFQNVRNADSSDALSVITDHNAFPEEGPERLVQTRVETRDSQRLTHDPAWDSEHHVELEHNGAEQNNDRGISLDSYNPENGNERNITDANG